MDEVMKEFKDDVLWDSPGTEIEAIDLFTVFKVWRSSRAIKGYTGRTLFNQGLKSMGYTIKPGKRTRLVVCDVSPRIGILSQYIGDTK